MSANYYAQVIRQQKAKRARRTLQKGRLQATKNGLFYSPRAKTLKKTKRPFTGFDGEGGGVNARGQQYYKLLRLGDELLFHNNKPLSTVDCLEFILDCPKKLYVGYGIGYDVTMILRDLPDEYIDKLFNSERGYTYWRDYAIDYLPTQYFRVARVNANGNGVMPGSSRTILETISFFQSSFVKALDTWGIGDKKLRTKMEKMKKTRGSFVRMTPRIIDYNRQECEWLAELMEKFRERCEQCNLVPRTWNGPGKIAAKLLKDHKVIRRDQVIAALPPEVLDAAQHAYYGGRAELSWVGVLDCWYYDINSAYPAAMLDVPCIEHGCWHQVEQLDALNEGDLFLADCDYNHPKGQVWCGLPHRATDSGLSWRRRGGGIYWSHEIFAAQRAGAKVKLKKAWLYEPRCACQPLGFVRDIYRQRKQLDKIEDGLGLPLKLAINSLYGKFAQQVGEAPFQNHLWAGFITAACRAKILDAIGAAKNPADIVMVATDGIYSRTPLPLDLGNELGNWDERDSATYLFVKPGIYWELKDKGFLKTRGMSPDALRAGKAEVEAAWHDYSRRIRNRDDRAPGGERIAPKPYPVLKLPMNGFTGLRIAHARGAPHTRGAWTDDLAKIDPQANIRKLGFAWGTKRMDWFIERTAESPGGLAVLTKPYDGTGARSAHWAPSDENLSHKESRQAQFWAEGQPDYLDPGEDI